MKPHALTKTILDSLKPDTKPYEIRDLKADGLSIRVLPSGVKVWDLRTGKGGKQRRRKIGHYPAMNLPKARLRAAEAAKDGDVLSVGPTVGKLVRLFLEFRMAHLREATKQDYYRRIENEILPHLKERRVSSLKRSELILLRDRLFPEAATSADHWTSLVREIIEVGVSRGLLEFNPADRIEKRHKKKKGSKREVCLSSGQIKAFWFALEDEASVYRVYYRLALLTGQRVGGKIADSGELLPAKWDEFNGDWWTIPSSRTKNGLTHRVPLTDLAKQQLALIPGAGYVFVAPIRQGRTAHLHWPRKPFERAVQKAGLGDFVRHDLRRNLVTQLGMMKYSNEQIARVVNHIQPGMTELYNSAEHDDLKREMLQKWSDKVAFDCGLCTVCKPA